MPHLPRPNPILLAVCGMEGAWLGQVAVWLQALTGDLISWPLVPLVVVLAAVSTLALLSTSWPIMRVRLLGAVVGVIVVLGVMPRFGLGLLLAGVAWYRGVGVGRSLLLIDDVFGYFTFGCIALVVSGLLRAAFPAAGPPGGGTEAVLAFFACGLVALALARLELLRRGRAAGGEAPAAVGRHWAGLLAITIFGVLGAAVLLAGAVSFQVLTDITRLMGGTLSLVLLAIVALALPFVFVMEQVIYGIRWLLAALGVAPEPVRPMPPEPMDFQELQEQVEEGGLAPEVILVVQAIGIGLVIAVALAILVFALFRYRRSREQQVEEERESIWSWPDAWAALLQRLHALWRRLLRGASPEPAAEAGPRWAEATEPAARTVREIYRGFLGWSAQQGLRRRMDQTPYEFLEELTRGMPDAEEDAAAITAAYVPVRYAEGPVEHGLVREAEAAWARLRETPVDSAWAR